VGGGRDHEFQLADTAFFVFVGGGEEEVYVAEHAVWCVAFTRHQGSLDAFVISGQGLAGDERQLVVIGPPGTLHSVFFV
jgi:hypothetical protein